MTRCATFLNVLDPGCRRTRSYETSGAHGGEIVDVCLMNVSAVTGWTEDWGSVSLRKVCVSLQAHTASLPRRPTST